jgi:Ca-activated chloride channel homolog
MVTEILRWFAVPEALALLLALPVLAFLVLWAWFARRRAWQMLGGMPARVSLASRLMGRGFWRGLLIASGLLLVGVAAAGPRWGREKTEIASAARDLVVLLDVSRSMLAETPSRQLRAQRVLNDLADTLRERGGHRVALVVVAAKAQLVVPLTTDYDLFQSAVAHQDASRLPTELRPNKDGPPSGTRLGEGLREAIAAHDAKYRTSQIILLVSDGDDPGGDGEWKEGANAARRAGIPVFVVGVGDPTKTSKIRFGDPLLPLTYEGQPVESTLNEELLKDIAERTDGTYFPVRTSKIEPGSLFPAILEAASALPRESAPAEDYHARFRWFLTAGLALLAGSLLLGDRRPLPGKAAEEEPVIQLGKPLPRPMPLGGAAAMAMMAAALAGAAPQVEDLLRQGNDAFQKKDYPTALKFYEQAEDCAPDPGMVSFNKGATLVRLGRFREAELCYLRCLQDRAAPAERRLKALYDLGTVLLQRGTDVKDVSALFRAGECFNLCFKEATDGTLKSDAEHNLELARLLWLKVRAEIKAPPDDAINNPPDLTDPRLNPMDQGDPERGRRGHKDPSGGKGERGQPGETTGSDTEAKLPGEGTIETLADSDQLQPLDGNDARELLAREIRRIEREQAQGPGQVQAEYRNVKDW